MSDSVNHPEHYTKHPSGVECIEITEHMNFNLGNALKYIWRAGLKGDAVEDLKKAEFYVRRELQRISNQAKCVGCGQMVQIEGGGIDNPEVWHGECRRESIMADDALDLLDARMLRELREG